MFLIAQTPRAGEGNHCLVVPYRLPISEREVFDRINTAIYQSEGKDYIAVSRLVEQTASIRQGREILMLVGVNVEDLSNTQRAEVRSKLEYYLSQFEVLVTQTIDWQTDSCTLLVYRAELEGWAEDKLFTRLPRKMLLYSRQGCLSFLGYFSRPKKVIHKLSSVPNLQKSQIKNIKTPQNCNDGKGLSFSKGGFVILMMIITIGFVSLIQYRKPHEQPIHSTAPKIKTEIFLDVLYEQGLINKKGDRRAKKELEHLLCGTPDKRFSECHELSFKSTDLNHLATRLLKEKGPRDFLRTQLNLEQINSLETIVKIRNQLRRLDAALSNTVPIRVYIPLLSEEDVRIAQRLEKKLAEALLESKKLSYYLNEEQVALTRQVTFNQLLNIWDETFSRKHLYKAKQALKELLNQVCHQSLICQIEKLHQYRQPQSIQDIIEAQEASQLFISEELGLNKLNQMPQPDQVVAIRNALRKINADINDKRAERIFLPLFQQEDVMLISTLKEEFELNDPSIRLLEGLRQKINRKPYRFFKTTMKKLIQKIDDVKENQ